MSVWPITTREAARRLGIPQVIANTLVKAMSIPIIPIGRANCLDEASYRQLEVASRPFQGRQRRRREAVAAGS